MSSTFPGKRRQTALRKRQHESEAMAVTEQEDAEDLVAAKAAMEEEEEEPVIPWEKVKEDLAL